ncbi:MAG: FtsQ-type POTRA domain-containing protein [Anaerolineales bacterium]|nr:FtsQ-type POTRA domain-containing protein [Anaerolineales bacterium]
MTKTINTRTERRGQKGKSPSNRRESSTVNVRRTPPVYSRSEIGINTAAVDNRPLPRRRVDLRLSSPGAEIRLPAVPAIHNKWRVLSGVLTVSILLGLILFSQTGLFRVEAIHMEGLERFSENEITQAINISGSSIFFINPENVKKDLSLTYPGLSEVDVHLNWPASVVITLEERTPVLAWNWDGNVRWVDKNGVAFEPHDDGFDVIQVKSAVVPPTIADRFVDPRIVDTVSTLAGLIPADTDLIYDSDHGLGWQDARGWTVYFGFNNDDAEQKMNVYLSLVNYLDGKRITPKIINVEFMDSPYFRMEQ